MNHCPRTFLLNSTSFSFDVKDFWKFYDRKSTIELGIIWFETIENLIRFWASIKTDKLFFRSHFVGLIAREDETFVGIDEGNFIYAYEQ